jgi:hypothetical protein
MGLAQSIICEDCNYKKDIAMDGQEVWSHSTESFHCPKSLNNSGFFN